MSSAVGLLERLPQELIDVILDYLHNDLPSLYRCSLTCRAFLPASRYHKFSSVSIRANGPGKSFCTCPIATEYALDVTVHHGRGFCTDMNRCRKLQRLAFKRTDFSCFNFPSITSLYPFAKVTSLELCQCHFANVSDIYHLLCEFPILTSFTLENNVCYGNTQTTDTIVTSPPLCDTLCLRYEFNPVIEGLLSLPDGIRFKSIQISTLGLYADPLNGLLRACGPNLHRLSSDAFELSLFNRGKFIDLSNNPNLRQISLPCTQNHNVELFPMLSTICSPFVSHINLTFETTPVQAWKYSQWGAVDALLSTARFSGLKVLRLTFLRQNMFQSESAETAIPGPEISEILPRLAARGLLDIKLSQLQTVLDLWRN